MKTTFYAKSLGLLAAALLVGCASSSAPAPRPSAAAAVAASPMQGITFSDYPFTILRTRAYCVQGVYENPDWDTDGEVYDRELVLRFHRDSDKVDVTATYYGKDGKVVTYRRETMTCKRYTTPKPGFDDYEREREREGFRLATLHYDGVENELRLHIALEGAETRNAAGLPKRKVRLVNSTYMFCLGRKDDDFGHPREHFLAGEGTLEAAAR